MPLGTDPECTFMEIWRTDGVGYVKSYPSHPIFLDGDI